MKTRKKISISVLLLSIVLLFICLFITILFPEISDIVILYVGYTGVFLFYMSITILTIMK